MGCLVLVGNDIKLDTFGRQFEPYQWRRCVQVGTWDAVPEQTCGVVIKAAAQTRLYFPSPSRLGRGRGSQCTSTRTHSSCLFIAQYLKSYSQRLRVRARCTSDSRHLGIIFKFHCIDLLPLDRGGVLYSPLLLQPARLTKAPNLPARAQASARAAAALRLPVSQLDKGQ